MSMSIIKEKLNKLPLEPGVYIFRDKSGKILYIGKATNLRSRVQSYFRGIFDIEKGIEVGPRLAGRPIEAMIYEVQDIDFQQPANTQYIHRCSTPRRASRSLAADNGSVPRTQPRRRLFF